MEKFEIHPLQPFLPKHAKLLMLGSFPPPHCRWSMEFFYPNLQNDMWRIFGLLFFDDSNHFLTFDRKQFDKERIVAFLQKRGVALFDSATVVNRLKENASDKFLEIITPTDIVMLLRKLPSCQAVVTTGQKATEIVSHQFAIAEPKIGHYSDFELDNRCLRFYRMPSSSRAYPKSITDKALFYRTLFHDLGML